MKIWYWHNCDDATRRSILESVAYIANAAMMQVTACGKPRSVTRNKTNEFRNKHEIQQ